MRILLLFICCLAEVAFAGRLQVYPRVYVAGPKIMLADLGDFGDLGSDPLKSIQKVNLGTAPNFGETRTFSAKAIAEILRSQIPGNILKGHQLLIPSDVQVIGQGVLVNVPNVRAALIDKLQEPCESCDILIDDLQVREINLPPESRWVFETDVSRLRGPFSIPIRIHVPQKTAEILWVQGRVRIQKRVPVASRAVPMGSLLTDKDFTFISRNITSIQDSFPTLPELVNSKVASTVGLGQVITRGMLVREKAVSSGELVTVTAGTEGWRVSLKAIAQQGGFIGDSIRLTNPETKKLISGVIIAKGVVETK